MSSVVASAALGTSTHTVHVQVSFHAADERQAQTVAAKLIDSAHEIANLPECECDVDVSVETSPLQGSPASEDASGAPPRGRPPKS
ncbi:MAG TPA: hypothetical protein VK730_08230 [Solirubrobacteraceae bacterium]|nr:hypothetical protein [Solirubrobacteraceae bacterium]